jgi:hypothetical protein
VSQISVSMHILVMTVIAAALPAFYSTSAQLKPDMQSASKAQASPYFFVPSANAVERRAAITEYFILSKFVLLIIKIVWINVYKHLRFKPYF